MNTDTLHAALAFVTAAWVLAFLLQLVDVVTGHKVRRAGRAAGTRDRDRILAWTVVVCAIVLVTVILGVDYAARLVLDQSELLWGSLLLVALAAAGAITAMLAARALRRPQTGYQVIRDELRGYIGSRLSKGRLVDYRAWLSTLDGRRNDLRRHIIAGRWVRVIPVLVAVTAFAAAAWLASANELQSWHAALYLVAVAASGWLAVWGARISLARNLAIHAVHLKQRAEAILLLEDLDRKTPRKVAGLSERVSRALAILREQQGQEDRPQQ